MRMLDDLKPILPEIESSNEWEHNFIEDMMIKKELGKTLSKKQFEKLNVIHQKYMHGKSRRLE